MAEKPVALITGVGPGTGAAIVRRFATDGFRVIALARSLELISMLQRKLPDTHAAQCDVSDESQVRDTITEIRDRFGSPSVLIHNAVRGGRGTFLEIDTKTLEENFRVNVMGLLYLARELAPAMIRAARGTILVTGDTNATRGKANSAGFAPTKAAQRILAESIARELGPRGIHVAYLLIDAVVDTPAMRKRFPDVSRDFFVRPSAIANELWHLSRQDSSAWSFLTELRPFGEKW
ncbi:SDR family NAD(P)-dependent oxidoreductase [Bradyrhizobium erythrophlei]|uniref:Short chain dehydrogenase n=1 Tax=Bradyrhizobium erythrophlei TaxID=1437360 RepID=A0A1H4WVC8_9BRAD|nr:SDR family NAD(P)-dependent oxidoreductase [Bradyrhizobium erythrophlei]SEC97352.1 short chain dehydrogenase [Bradyrhizobium erythrophlei]